MKRPGVIVVIVAGVIAVVGLAAVLLGYVSITIKTPQQAAKLVTDVCSRDIEQYNTISGQASDDQLTKLREFADTIDKKNGADKDVNCLFMSAQARAFSGDRETARQRVDQLEKIHNSTQVYASGAINSLVGIRDLKVATAEEVVDDKPDEW